MKIHNRALLTATALMLSLFASALQAEDIQWLYGHWEQTYDPDFGLKDTLDFAPRGKFKTAIPFTGDKYNGVYKVVDGKVMVTVQQNRNNTSELVLDISEDKKTLFYKSPQTGNVSHYEKEEALGSL